MRCVDRTTVPVLYAFSEHVVPRPFDWPEHAHVTGCWFLDEGDDWQPPEALCQFLNDGPPPAYVGFGSMGGARADARTAAVCRAVSLAEQRAVLVAGWGGLKSISPTKNVFALESAPHDWLFPRMSVVVHHGGAGSTMAGLRAGKPTVVCPFLGDQPFWGTTVYRAGLGPKPIPQSALTAEHLAKALREALEPSLAVRAQAIGERIRAEDGASRAVAIIEEEHLRFGASRS